LIAKPKEIMRRAFQGIDHAVIAVRDLDKAAETWERLGFFLAPKSGHPELGSQNRCIIMHGDYIELLNPGDHEATRFLSDCLETREGMAALALRSPDIEASRGLLGKAGFSSSEPLSFSRPLIVPSGASETARFTVTMIDPAQTPGGQILGCHHHTPQHIWAVGYENHPNRAERISAVIFGATDVAKSARIFERIFDSMGRGGANKSIEVPTGDVPIFVVSEEALPKIYSNVAVGIRTPCFAGLSIQVYDLQETARVLTENGVPFVGSPSIHLLVAPEHANGVLLEFYRRSDGP
jgi:catechol 2,3-dioxygenase-like lactoylglutathione lyase family enzyme